jgi:hypothetical protein
MTGKLPKKRRERAQSLAQTLSDMPLKPWHIRRAEIFLDIMRKADAMSTHNRLARTPLSSETCNFLVLDSENTPLLAIYLAAHPDEAIRLCYLDPGDQRSELERIDAMLNGRAHEPGHE